MNILKLSLTFLTLALSTPSLAQEDEQGHEEEEGAAVEMTAAEQTAAGVTTSKTDRRGLSGQVRMPAEVVVNAYQSASVTTRIRAQVMTRHVKLGDIVEPGQALVTLSSVEMAEAQGQYVIADREWQRVRGLGKAAVSERRYIEAEIARRQALAKILAYGMTTQQADRLLASDSAALATGEFELLAPQRGTHQLDETTRRQGLRIEVDNTDDHLHPGQFVEAEISTGEGPSVLAVPSEAITLIKGVPTVFLLEEGHEFHPQSVETGVSSGGWTEIRVFSTSSPFY